jgi:hypothetical protein
MNKQVIADKAVELIEECAVNDIPITVQIDFTEQHSENPELFLAALGDMSDYIAMTAEHLVVQAEAQAEAMDKPLEAVISTMVRALAACIEVSKGSDTISDDIEEIRDHLSVPDKETLN